MKSQTKFLVAGVIGALGFLAVQPAAAAAAAAAAATAKPAAKPATAPALPAPPPQPLVIEPQAIDAALKSFVDSQKIVGVSALVYQNDKEVYFGAYGFAETRCC